MPAGVPRHVIKSGLIRISRRRDRQLGGRNSRLKPRLDRAEADDRMFGRDLE
jgi:hypothetical protein